MNDGQSIEVEDLVGQNRKSLQRPPESFPAAPTETPSDSTIANALTSLQHSSDIYHIQFTSHRKVFGPLVVLAKKVARQLLTPILERQLAYNAANTRLITHLSKQVTTLQKRTDELAAETTKMRQEQTAGLQALRTEVKDVISECLANMSQIDKAFPKADLLVNKSSFQLAETLLEEVKHQISAMGEDILAYFRNSRDRYQFALQLIVDHPKGKVLDLGCSPGHMAMALSNAGFEVFGIDLSTAYLPKYPNQSWVERLQIKHVAFEQEPIPFPEAFFDYVIFTEVLEHIAITDPLAILLEIKRVLKPGGFMVLSTPNVANISNALALAKGDNIFWDPSIFYGGLDRHNREYTPREVVNLLAKAQFSRYELAYITTPSNWNSKMPEIYELMGKWQGNPELSKEPFFNNTIFIRAVK
jgi:2-polyprenyl-3-methyl-5-hydroxy-6-metoxy-1,4-benzoquinol methylase